MSKVSEKCARPLPPNLLAVQRAASRELKLSAKRVEEILERLYLQRTITYPRTETTVYPKWFDTEEQYRCLNIALPNKKRLQHTISVWDLQAGQTINVSIYIRSR